MNDTNRSFVKDFNALLSLRKTINERLKTASDKDLISIENWCRKMLQEEMEEFKKQIKE